MPQTRGLSPLTSPPVMAGLITATMVGGLVLAGRLESHIGGIVAAVSFAVGVVASWLSRVRDRALREAEAQDAPARPPHEDAPPYASLVNALPDPLLVITAEEPDDLTGRRFILANRAARELLRITSDTGLLVTAIRDPEVLEAVDEALFGQVQSEAIYDLGGAQDRVLRAMTKPLIGTPGGPKLALLVLRDETEVRRSERTRADFMANASHELRTPLASLSGFIETLRGHARADEGARDKFLGIMQTQADRMSRLIDDLLSLSRIEMNEHIAPASVTDIALSIMDVADSLSPLALERQVKLQTELPEAGAALCLGDRDQIVQVVQNLADNALKYSTPGSAVRISLRLGLTAEAATAAGSAEAARLSLLTPDRGSELYAVLRVSDAGPGLAREHLPRLTERFYRVEGQKSGPRSGTGLGLAIVQHIMNRHRGGMAVESQEGKGATFIVYFPLPANTSPNVTHPRDHVVKVS